MDIINIIIVLVIIGVLYDLVKRAHRGLKYDPKKVKKMREDAKKKSDNDWWDDVDEMFENLNDDGEG